MKLIYIVTHFKIKEWNEIQNIKIHHMYEGYVLLCEVVSVIYLCGRDVNIGMNMLKYNGWITI